MYMQYTDYHQQMLELSIESKALSRTKRSMLYICDKINLANRICAAIIM